MNDARVAKIVPSKSPPAVVHARSVVPASNLFVQLAAKSFVPPAAPVLSFQSFVTRCTFVAKFPSSLFEYSLKLAFVIVAPAGTEVISNLIIVLITLFPSL